VHPAVIDRYLTGDLSAQWSNASARGSAALTREERKLLAFLASV
jgi:DNA topoisomerase IB